MTRTDESLQSKVALIAEECIAVSLRLLTRAVTKIYNHALRPHGLTVGQMNILVAASLMGQARQQDICRVLFLDKSTLSRDLTRMRERGWISESPGDDARSSVISVTALGGRLLEKAIPAWEHAQQEATALLGAQDVAALGRVAKSLRASGVNNVN